MREGRVVGDGQVSSSSVSLQLPVAACTLAPHASKFRIVLIALQYLTSGHFGCRLMFCQKPRARQHELILSSHAPNSVALSQNLTGTLGRNT